MSKDKVNHSRAGGEPQKRISLRPGDLPLVEKVVLSQWARSLLQAFIFAWIYQEAFAKRNGSLMIRGLRYGVTGAVHSWSFTTLAVAAKNVMTSVPDYLAIETAFTAVQWIMVGPLTSLAFARAPQKATVGISF